MADVIPVKIVVGLRANGDADHPDFNLCPSRPTQGDIERHGGFVYDKTSLHRTDTPESPYGTQLAMILLDPALAKEVINTFPTVASEMTELEAKDFWDNKAYAHVMPYKLFPDALTALNAEMEILNTIGAPQAAKDALAARMVKALDPDDVTELGKTAYPLKTWDGMKAHTGRVVGKLP